MIHIGVTQHYILRHIYCVTGDTGGYETKIESCVDVLRNSNRCKGMNSFPMNIYIDTVHAQGHLS